MQKYFIGFIETEEIQDVFNIIIMPATIMSLFGQYLSIPFMKMLNDSYSKKEFEKKTFNVNGKNYEVTFKTGYVNGEVISKRPEYEDLKRIAQDSGLPLKEVKELIK